jgi:hypothetical protein
VTVPAAMPTGAPTAVPVAEPAGALVPVATKGGLASGWGRAVAVAPAMVPVGAPAAVTAPTTRSHEVEAAA